MGRRDKYKEKKKDKKATPSGKEFLDRKADGHSLLPGLKDLVWLDTTRSFGDIRLKAPHNIVP